MAKKKKFSLDKGKEKQGFNISKGEKSSTGFGLDKGAKSVSSNKAKETSAFGLDKGSKVSSTKKEKLISSPSTKKDVSKPLSEDKSKKNSENISSSKPLSENNKSSNKSKLYAILGIAAIVAIAFFIFNGNDQDSSNLSSQTVENTDTDMDGIPDEKEIEYGTNPNLADSDNDGQNDGNEIISGSDPNDSNSNFIDTDKDGLGDDFEKNNGLDPNNSKDAIVENSDNGKSKSEEFISNFVNSSDKLVSQNTTSNENEKSNNGSSESIIDSSNKTKLVNNNSSNSDSETNKTSTKKSVASSSDGTSSKPKSVSSTSKSENNTFTFKSNDVLYYFEFGSSYINSGDKKLNKLSKELKSSRQKVILIGHTDNIGDEYINTEISKSRAKAVYQFLINKGVNKNLISIEGYGEDRPLNSNSNSNQRALNRRVEIILN